MARPKAPKRKPGSASVPQPKATCQYCGRRLSQRAMNRHIGTQKCSREYWERQLKPSMALPPGYRVVGSPAETIAWQVTKKVGYLPDTSPVRRVVVWEGGDPMLQVIAPTWLAITLDAMAEQRWIDNRDKQDLGLLEKLDEDEVLTFKGVFGVLYEDTITLLQYFENDAEGFEAAMATELDFVAKVDHGWVISYDHEKVVEVVRRWATEAMKNM